MCGINGVLRLTPDAPELDLDEVTRTREAMARRGPDGVGLWSSPDGTIALAHRRLAILDLSAAAAQPMADARGRLRLIFNGEIYNFRELAAELERRGGRLRTVSDSEVILELFAREGAASFSRLRGMYALAIWDEVTRELTLARDPYGIKPLYVANDGRTLRFASQVKALEASGRVSRELDLGALGGFLIWGAVPAPRTIRAAIREVAAGTVERFREGRPLARERIALPTARGLDLGHAIAESVEAHLVSDVPVALFLSAGLDSGLIARQVAAAELSGRTALTLRFDEASGSDRDEGPVAAEVAERLGFRHVERRIGRRDIEPLEGELLSAMDQPSIDGFNTFLVARLARDEGFKVVLSGLGGDELLGGYPSFSELPRWRRWTARAAALPGSRALWSAATVPWRARRPKLARALSLGSDLAALYVLRRALFLPDELPAILGEERARAALASYDPVEDARRVLAEAGHGRANSETLPSRPEGNDDWSAVQALESGLYLRHQLLRDADWAAMAHSVELRVPLVDAWLTAEATAAAFEPARSRGRAALVAELAPELPPAVLAGRKRGFHLPIADWLEPSPDGRSRSIGAQSRVLARRVLAGFGDAELALPGAA